MAANRPARKSKVAAAADAAIAGPAYPTPATAKKRQHFDSQVASEDEEEAVGPAKSRRRSKKAKAEASEEEEFGGEDPGDVESDDDAASIAMSDCDLEDEDEDEDGDEVKGGLGNRVEDDGRVEGEDEDVSKTTQKSYDKHQAWMAREGWGDLKAMPKSRRQKNSGSQQGLRREDYAGLVDAAGENKLLLDLGPLDETKVSKSLQSADFARQFRQGLRTVLEKRKDQAIVLNADDKRSYPFAPSVAAHLKTLDVEHTSREIVEGMKKNAKNISAASELTISDIERLAGFTDTDLEQYFVYRAFLVDSEAITGQYIGSSIAISGGGCRLFAYLKAIRLALDGYFSSTFRQSYFCQQAVRTLRKVGGRVLVRPVYIGNKTNDMAAEYSLKRSVRFFEGIFGDVFQSIETGDITTDDDRVMNSAGIMEHHYAVRPAFLTSPIPGLNKVSPLVQGLGNRNGSGQTTKERINKLLLDAQPSNGRCPYCDIGLIMESAKTRKARGNDGRPHMLTNRNQLFGKAEWVKHPIICVHCYSWMYAFRGNKTIGKQGMIQNLLALGGEDAVKAWHLKGRPGKADLEGGEYGQNCPLCETKLDKSSGCNAPAYPKSTTAFSYDSLKDIKAICYRCSHHLYTCTAPNATVNASNAHEILKHCSLEILKSFVARIVNGVAAAAGSKKFIRHWVDEHTPQESKPDVPLSDKPFPCTQPKCGKGYNSKYTLGDHVRDKHPETQS
ncbi:hypothetical protein LTR78_004015 [Recurvomyces mirabilis]|uniref:C2H2-type domain-containing protein n=1 Tax=Recurvomyces mirabilis TaxID=574656 RepID=A0AAE0WQR5_9PEZI|nr:hypothetical protein LTR78_004015 [Recurvomyces mirabilis]KAK5153846.1 hypothetical protein LTS14_007066 [Recurvomyces mirabilis]